MYAAAPRLVAPGSPLDSLHAAALAACELRPAAEPFPTPSSSRVKKAIGGSKNGKDREVPAVKAPKWYPADDIKAKVPGDREANSRGVAKLKKTIKAGSVLIMLGGRFRGKRVVFLKQLSSGLLLVTGPYKTNGVPLRRVNMVRSAIYRHFLREDGCMLKYLTVHSLHLHTVLRDRHQDLCQRVGRQDSS